MARYTVRALLCSAVLLGALSSTALSKPMNYVGSWANTNKYSAGQVVYYNGALYYSLKSSRYAPNINLIPSNNPTWWTPVGTIGNTILSGVVNPTSPDLGQVGDFYINTTTNTIFGPKTATSPFWPATGVSLVGAGGEAGSQGPQGVVGPIGPQGPQGPAGATGATGPAGAQGPTGNTGPIGPTGPNPPPTLTLNVDCDNGGTIQTAIDTVVAGTAATINVTGDCSENVVVPEGKTVFIDGGGTATLVPANDSRTVVSVWGRAELTRFTVSNSTGSAELLSVKSGSFIVSGSTINGNNQTGWVFYVSANSRAELVNSKISGGQWGSVNASQSSSLVVYGVSDDVAGPDGFRTTISNEIWCSGGSSVSFYSTTGGGAVDVNGGIRSDNCSLDANGSSDKTVVFTNQGMNFTNTQAVFENIVSVSAIFNLLTSDVVFRNSELSSAPAPEHLIYARGSSKVAFEDRGDPTTVNEIADRELFLCIQGSSVFAIDNGLGLPVGKTLADVAALNNGCFDPVNNF